MIAAGDNPDRLRSEASFAHLCGAAPVQASSGKVVRHRLNPGGNRDANRALHVVALNRMRRDPRTRGYVARRTAEGKSKREAMRCLKRYTSPARPTARSYWTPGPAFRRVDEDRSVEVCSPLSVGLKVELVALVWQQICAKIRLA